MGPFRQAHVITVNPAPGHLPDLATARPGVALKTPGPQPTGAEAASPGPRPGAEAGY
jgi:hypothetical protein